MMGVVVEVGRSCLLEEVGEVEAEVQLRMSWAWVGEVVEVEVLLMNLAREVEVECLMMRVVVGLVGHLEVVKAVRCCEQEEVEVRCFDRELWVAIMVLQHVLDLEAEVEHHQIWEVEVEHLGFELQ